MAGAEARAVWQRAANRWFVQEDAKRAPKLACYPSTPSRQIEAPYVNDDFAPLNDKSTYSSLSDSRWWLRVQPDYIHQWGLTDEKVNAFEARYPNQFVDNEDSNSQLRESYEFVEMDSFDCCDRFKEVKDFSLDSKVHPWWRMTEKDDLGSFSSKTSLGFRENRDPIDMNWKPQKIECENPVSRVEVKHVSSKPISPQSTNPEMETSKAKILEALRHSQTRAREAENAAKEAYAEKDHVIKILFKQASELFAYKQWLYILQLENLYYQIKNESKPFKNRKKNPRAAKGKPRAAHGVGGYAVVFVVGLGLVGAGLLLGWTVGWMLI